MVGLVLLVLRQAVFMFLGVVQAVLPLFMKMLVPALGMLVQALSYGLGNISPVLEIFAQVMQLIVQGLWLFAKNSGCVLIALVKFLQALGAFAMDLRIIVPSGMIILTLAMILHTFWINYFEVF